MIGIREGEFEGKRQGYCAAQNNMVHPATAAAVAIVTGNEVNGMNTIYSGIHGTPWSAGKFAVSIGKFNAGPFTTKPSDPDQAY